MAGDGAIVQMTVLQSSLKVCISTPDVTSAVLQRSVAGRATTSPRLVLVLGVQAAAVEAAIGPHRNVAPARLGQHSPVLVVVDAAGRALQGDALLVSVGRPPTSWRRVCMCAVLDVEYVQPSRR